MDEARKAFIQERNKIMVHCKIICNILDAPDDLVQKAKTWLRLHGASETINII